MAVDKCGLLACMISLHHLQKLIANGEVVSQFAYLSLHACVACSELLRNFEQFSLSLFFLLNSVLKLHPLVTCYSIPCRDGSVTHPKQQYQMNLVPLSRY